MRCFCGGDHFLLGCIGATHANVLAHGSGAQPSVLQNHSPRGTQRLACCVANVNAIYRNTTKGESVEFGTSEIEGQISTLANGNWSATKTFNTMTEAQAYLESFFGSATSATVTFNVNGGTGTVASVSTYVGAIINVPDGTGITPPANKHFVGWDTTSSSTKGDITGTYKVPSASVTLYAIWASN